MYITRCVDKLSRRRRRVRTAFDIGIVQGPEDKLETLIGIVQGPEDKLEKIVVVLTSKQSHHHSVPGIFNQ
jgi:hypothetical protein